MVSGASGFTISRRTLEGLNGKRPVFAQPASIFFFVIPLSLARLYIAVKCSLLTFFRPPR